MIYLLLSILTSSAIFLLFKWFGKKNIHVFEAIVANYVVALAIGIVVVDDLPEAMHSAMEFPSWFIAALCLGAVFIGMFYLMALASQKMGVASTSIASKMSLALTVLLIALSDPDEHVGFLRVVIILMALAGVVLSSYRKGEKMIETKFIGWSLLILVISTVIDFSLAHFSKMPVTESELQLFSCVPFFTAAVIGLTVVVRHFFTAGYRMRPKDFFSGILLGIVNYASIFFLVKSFDSGFLPKSALLPVNNISIVIASAAGAYILLREKLSKSNLAGLGLSLISLLLLLLL